MATRLICALIPPIPITKRAAIHFVFVPAILWATLVWVAAAGPLAPLPKSAALSAALARLPPWLAGCARLLAGRASDPVA
jgi:hypothetical protein